MASPMIDMPRHLMIGVDEYRQGPASAEDTVRFVCWCGDRTCDGPDPSDSFDEEE